MAERQSWTPPIDVVETDDAIVLKAELAGMDPKDINIEVQDNVLTVSGERRFEEEVKEDKYYRIERRYGSFSRSLALPQTADESKVEAKYENGVLEVTVSQGRDREAQEDHGQHRRRRKSRRPSKPRRTEQIVTG